MTPELNFNWVHSESIGYGRLGVKLDEALRARGVDVVDGQPGPTRPDVRPCNVTVWVSTPSHAKGWYEGQRPIMFTMFEATTLPEAFREALHNFPLVIVPSMQNKELFSEHHDNVAYVPLGVDPKDWHYVKRQPPTRYFRFLIGGSGERKGTDLAHAAFRKVFGHGAWAGGGPEPILVMKNPRGEDFFGERVEMVTGKVSPEEEQAIYRQAHCYLQPSRGEGFGLQPLQALAQGIPTILTDAHGHEAFSELGYGLSTTMSKSGYFLFGDAGDWWEPNLDELCDYMRYVYDNYEAAEARAEQSSRVVAERFTWANVADNFVAAIGDEHLTTPFDGNRTWVQPEYKRYLVRVSEPWAADVAGVRYQFMPGLDTYELADVKRIMFEAGKLDPSCIDPHDSGLTPEQVARLGDYSASHGHCRLCGQQLGGRTKHDEIMERLEPKPLASFGSARTSGGPEIRVTG